MTPRLRLRVLTALLALGLVAAACGSDSADTDTATANTETGADEADDAPEESSPEPEEPAAPAYATLNVPADHATIQAAVDAAVPGDLVLIDAGVYNESIVVQTDNIVIRGIDRNTVILDGEHAAGMENGIIIFSNGVAVENLTVRNYTINGLFWTGDYGNDVFVEGYRASYVTAHNIGVYGLYAFNAVDGQFDHTYASGSDDASFYVGQCDPCNALLYEVVGENSQLGYSGTNSSDVVIANSEFMNNMIGVVPNSSDGEELAPNRNTIIIGNYIHDNNNENVPSRHEGYRLGLGSGVVLGGTIANVVERNTIVNNTRAGVIILDWVAIALGGNTDYDAIDNIVRDNIISGSTLDADLLLALVDVTGGAQGNCFENNVYGSSTPADIEVTLPCGGAPTAEFVPLDQLLGKFNLTFEPTDYRDSPIPDYTFDSMPDAATAPPEPATNMPMAIDLDAIVAPPVP